MQGPLHFPSASSYVQQKTKLENKSCQGALFVGRLDLSVAQLAALSRVEENGMPEGDDAPTKPATRTFPLRSEDGETRYGPKILMTRMMGSVVRPFVRSRGVVRNIILRTARKSWTIRVEVWQSVANRPTFRFAGDRLRLTTAGKHVHHANLEPVAFPSRPPRLVLQATKGLEPWCLPSERPLHRNGGQGQRGRLGRGARSTTGPT